MGKLFLLFTALPLLDLWLLLQIGRALGAWGTIALVIATGVAGASLARAEGFRVIREWQRAIAEARLPAEGVLSGVLVLAGGLLLVTPGVITDVLGLALLVPASRRLVAGAVRRWLVRQLRSGRIHVVTSRGGFAGPGGGGEPIDVTPPRPEAPVPDEQGRPGSG